MIIKRILVVAPYPIVKPRHGGQKRAQALFEFYKSSFSQVKYVGVFHRGQYPDWSEDDILLGDIKLINEIDKKPYASEIIAGEAIDKDIHVRSHFAKMLVEYKPDIIHIEQPYPYLGLKAVLRDLGMNPAIIFGSQNIEYPLKKKICDDLKIPPKISEEIVGKTKDLEKELSQKANLVVAVNNEDAIYHRSLGSKRCIVAPNGINTQTPTGEASSYWKKYKQDNKIEKLITFVGSGHPPNWVNFLETVGYDLGFLPGDTKLVIAGGVASYFKSEFKKKNSKYTNFWNKVKMVEDIEDDFLSGLIDASEVVILPILTKRGSNLKTAEAILSGKKIVATNYAFKGFEDYQSIPNVYVVNEPNKFNDSISKALSESYKKPTKKEWELSQGVRWSNSLKPIKKEFTRLEFAVARNYLTRLLKKIKIVK